MNVRTSESVKHIATALLEAQQICAAPAKSSKNPHFGSMYANLESVRAAMFMAFADRALVVIQMPGFANGAAVVTNRVLHAASGEWIEWEAASPIAKNDPQSWRGAITYIRRTCLEGIGNLAAEDDDGSTASQAPKPKAKPASSVKSGGVLFNEKQKAALYKKAQDDKDLVHREISKATGEQCTLVGWPPITAEQYEKIIEGITLALDEKRLKTELNHLTPDE